MAPFSVLRTAGRLVARRRVTGGLAGLLLFAGLVAPVTASETPRFVGDLTLKGFFELLGGNQVMYMAGAMHVLAASGLRCERPHTVNTYIAMLQSDAQTGRIAQTDVFFDALVVSLGGAGCRFEKESTMPTRPNA